MERIKYFEILKNIPNGHEVEFFTEKLKLAKRDYFCENETFIRELRQALDGLENDILQKTAKKKNELENNIETAYECGDNIPYNMGIDVLEGETYEQYHNRQTERRIKNWKSELEELINDAYRQTGVIKNWRNKVDELERVVLDDGTDKKQNYQIDTTLFKTIYKHCQDKEMFGIDEADFIKRVECADFSGEIYNDGNKTRMKVLIKMIGRKNVICESWYTDAVGSLGIAKNELTKSQNGKLEDELKAIIDKWRVSQKEFRKGVDSEIKSLNPK